VVAACQPDGLLASVAADLLAGALVANCLALKQLMAVGRK
jgi:hypothetical protein